ncbi:MAG: hypothetical protein C4320_04710, partial [Armatimonadota bacterium]
MTPPTWDLAFLFASLTDPGIDESWSQAHGKADALQRFRGRFESGNADGGELAEALAEVEQVYLQASKPQEYASLVYAADASRPEHGAFYQEQAEKGTEVAVKLMFLELELQGAPEEAVARWSADPRMAPYLHYLKMVRVYAPYRLSEKEEVLLEEVANTGPRAWGRLFDETLSN